MVEPTRWLDRSQADAWLSLVTVLELLPPALDSQLLRDQGLTFFEFVVLAQLAELPDHSLRLTDLAAMTNSTPPRISRVVARLERDGFLERRVNAEDGRSRQVHLTERGHRKLADAAPAHIDLVNSVFTDGLSARQLDHLTTICAQIIGRLDPGRQVFSEAFAGHNGRPGLSRAP